MRPKAYPSCIVECGAPEYVNWQTAQDLVAPLGWKIQGFSGNVGDARLCKDGWNAFAHFKDEGTLWTQLRGYGTVTAKYRDCWKEGHATVYLNGKQMGQSGHENGELTTTRC